MVQTICLITNFNYSIFLVECLNSVLNQSTPFNRIIIVDDGSTDNSLDIIRFYAKNYPQIIVITKENGGQLSAFNAAVKFISNGERIFFLDADDLYPSDYLEACLNILQQENVDFAYCCDIQFSAIHSPLTSSKINPSLSNDVVNCTAALSQLLECWFGGPTSCISLSGKLFKEIFPYPDESEWRSRADDVIIYASSALRYKKLFMPSIGIAYRLHGKNNFLNKASDPIANIKRTLAIKKLFTWYATQFSLTNALSLSCLLGEFFSLSPSQRKRHAVPMIHKLIYQFWRSKYIF